MRRALALAPLALAACVSVDPGDAEQVAATVVARVYPGLSTAPVANCVRDHASAEELAELASFSGNVGSAAQILTLQIIDRPETDACLRSNGITLGN